MSLINITAARSLVQDPQANMDNLLKGHLDFDQNLSRAGNKEKFKHLTLKKNEAVLCNPDKDCQEFKNDNMGGQEILKDQNQMNTFYQSVNKQKETSIEGLNLVRSLEQKLKDNYGRQMSIR